MDAAVRARGPERGVPGAGLSDVRRGGAAGGAAGGVVEATVSVGPERLDLLWLNSPGNPTGRVLPLESPGARWWPGPASATP